MKTTALLLTALLVLAETAGATLTVSISGETLRDSASNPIPTNALIFLVADTNNDGFAPIKLNVSTGVNSDISGDGDRIVGVFDASLWGTPGVFQNTTSNYLLSSITNWNAGDSLAIYWFPTLTLSSTEIAAGTTYGMFAGPGSSSENWVTPSDGGFLELSFLTQDASTLVDPGTGNFPDSMGNASLVVAIPEPRTWMFVCSGGLMMLWWTRRRRAWVA